MIKAIFPDDVMGIIKNFLDCNAGDEATENIILAIGAEILDISVDTLLEYVTCNRKEN